MCCLCVHGDDNDDDIGDGDGGDDYEDDDGDCSAAAGEGKQWRGAKSCFLCLQDMGAVQSEWQKRKHHKNCESCQSQVTW